MITHALGQISKLLFLFLRKWGRCTRLQQQRIIKNIGAPLVLLIMCAPLVSENIGSEILPMGGRLFYHPSVIPGTSYHPSVIHLITLASVIHLITLASVIHLITLVRYICSP